MTLGPRCEYFAPWAGAGRVEHAREGFVVLQQGATDRRRRHIVLTSKGKTKCREALRLWQRAQDRFEQVFGVSEAAALRATLLRIAHHERLAALKD